MASAPDNSQGLYEQDIAYSDGQLFVSDTNGLGYQRRHQRHRRLRRVDLRVRSGECRWPSYGFASGLAAGNAAPSEDWYSFQANAGDMLAVSLSLPGDTTGTYQFANWPHARVRGL